MLEREYDLSMTELLRDMRRLSLLLLSASPLPEEPLAFLRLWLGSGTPSESPMLRLMAL